MTPVDHNFIFFTEPHMHILASVVHCIKFECSLFFFFFVLQPIAVSKGLFFFFLSVVPCTNFFFFVLVVLTMTVSVV